MSVDATKLAQLRRFGRPLARLPRDCSTTLGSRMRRGAGPDNRILTYAHYADLTLLAALSPGTQSLCDMQRASELRRVRHVVIQRPATP
jgi:hypothetical protein